ncbi:glycoside hydrolase family 94 protein [uncultured Thiodictyon sp.]|uniref:glycoside hydrolase family 94 protein n=1 Tax=uncultured Thiodictyon sp. TaxID=1846217 RepID=UPI0025CF63A2|nr:glycoside hydrolase family 94 protein [uncultured Thiodictyon sp.]
MRLLGNGLTKTYVGDEQPLRDELFSAVQMEQHGKALAESHVLTPRHGPDQLLVRLNANEATLVDVCALLIQAVAKNRRIAPAGEWLLDNFYLIEEQIRTAKRHLPKGYSRELPRLRSGPSAGLPRVYDIALEIIAHGDGRVDPETLSRFVAAYQGVISLRLGELWAIPIMLRLALIENLRRVAARIAGSRTGHNLADAWADEMVAMAARDPKNVILVIADMARSQPPLSSAFVAEFARRLQGQSPALALPLTWIEQNLADAGLTTEELVQAENQQQAADQISISNSIGSLRFLGAMDWREFVETMSVVECTLRRDPGGVYGRMDFATRDRYRHVVERIAKGCDGTEEWVARHALDLAVEGAARSDDAERAGHVGYYLIDRGLVLLERRAKARVGVVDALQRRGRRIPLFLYLGAISLLSALFAASLLAPARAADWPLRLLIPLTMLALLGSSQLAVALVNWLATLLATPYLLPRMELSTGIPPESRTLVVTPTMLSSVANIESLVEALEVRCLANQDDHLHFGLLTDLRDAQSETLPGDAALVQLAGERIEALNVRYPRPRGDTFFLFHRPRVWNPQERVWMGYERKRGKLAALNALLRGAPTPAGNDFALIVGDLTSLSDVRYVITLDTDTQLPRDSARALVGAMAHPLNRPRYDAGRALVGDGYAILQPRVAVSLPGANRSRYARLCGSDAGLDPYTHAVSDLYQDWFQEGSFIGKGIYDVTAFERALAGRFPENRILSHDLLEGCYARSGLLSDVQLYEDSPAGYSADVSRRYRWIRGDWQVAGWLWPRVPAADGGWCHNALSALSRWKLADNLRRSLVPAALTLLYVLGWVLLSAPGYWTLAVLGISLVPSLLTALLNGLQKPGDVRWGQHLGAALYAALRQLAQAGFAIACLPYEAWFSLDAVLRTRWRMWVSHRGLLEWTASGELNTRSPGVVGCVRQMVFAPMFALLVALGLAAGNPAALWVAAPILLMWFASPVIAWWLSRPLTRHVARLSAAQTRFLRTLARRTWDFFETFVGPADHWLPPDNYQEHPVAMVAHRTSPTNMGLSLLANLAAYDFGYLPVGALIERTTDALRTMAGLERYRGHFFNWYDTESLLPLPPVYISSVDSGNLAGHLLTLQPGLLALVDDPIFRARTLAGLSDSFHSLVDASNGVLPVALTRFAQTLQAQSLAPPNTLPAVRQCLEQLAADAESGLIELAAGAGDEAHRWARALARECRAALDELLFLVPWLGDPTAPGDLPQLTAIPTLRQLAAIEAQWVSTRAPEDPGQAAGAPALQPLIALAGGRARGRIRALELLALQAGELAQMDCDFLYDEAQHLLAIGYHVAERRRDTSCYDLLASEARLGQFVAIAQDQLPQESWFALGRLLTKAAGESTLLSWSGSMFEYLMPLLVMPTYDNTLLDQTYRAAVAGQIAYGRARGVPWGVSESGYNTVDTQFNYQYRAFGVPGLGLKRGLADDLVIAPYACALALMVAPEAACANLQRLAAAGFAGRFGFYEAIDYTPARLPRGQTSAVVRSFMAHHQGMSLLALAYLLLDRPMQRRFESVPQFQATALLLQERIPKTQAFYSHANEGVSDFRPTGSNHEAALRVFSSPNTRQPQVQLLSNGRYHVMVTNAGGGYSRWKDLAVTRWREDSTRDAWGTFCYLRDQASGAFWSTTYQPTLTVPERYEAIFSEGRAEFRRRDHEIESYTEIVVSPEDDIELRRVRITNRARTRRVIEITSYTEVVLAPPAADALHPAFSNLFVQTQCLNPQPALLCTRRPRSQAESSPWMFHLMVARGADCGTLTFETDRLQFIGRGRTVAAPAALGAGGVLTGSVGSVLDPIVAIRYELTLDPDQTATLDLVTGVADTREAAVGLVAKYQDQRLADRCFDLAWTHSQVVLRQLNASAADAQLYGQLAGAILYSNAVLRAEASVLIKNHRGQSGLWSHAVSGDVPLVLVQITDPVNIELIHQLVQAHAYWRLKGLTVDLVIWNEDHAGYRQQLQDQIMGLIAAGVEAHVLDRPGGIFIRPADQISSEDRILFQTVARAILSDSRGTLAEQLGRREPIERQPPRLRPIQARRPSVWPEDGTDGAARSSAQGRGLLFDNGLGGFTRDGGEYVITVGPTQATPAPWVNILANPLFGSVISESGAAYTWSENAHEFRLTPWHNDPVSDASGEAFYLRDEETGRFWSPTPLPCRGATPYVIRHGFGYSVFEHTEEGIQSELWVYVALDLPLKFSVLKLRNLSGRSRRLSATGYVEWVLGDLRPKTTPYVITEIDPSSGALFARNPYNTEFGRRLAFFDVDDATRTLTGDRTEFIGRNGSLSRPAALLRTGLSGRVGAALDACAALQVGFELAAGEGRELVFRLGMAGRHDADDPSNTENCCRGGAGARDALAAVRQYWQHTLGAVRVETPDPALDLLANGWLIYQTLACRLWARSGFYQSGGAFGFRDQLQDVMALMYAEPRLAREQLLRCAGRQFHEGDVQHWWHPPTGRGVRTHCSDDYLWLPLVTCRYVQGSADVAVLDEPVGFLEGRLVSGEDDSYYDLPGHSEDTQTLYQHCVRAIMHGLRFGAHGLPLMGSGDWNDGMNLVGMKGQGESVWLGFFLYEVLERFSVVAGLKGDLALVARCREEAEQLRRNLDQHGWDGGWYRRAYFDNGVPLGSAINPECQIDSIAQSWSVLSGAGAPERARLGMAALDARLVRRDLGLIQLLDPPFDTSKLDPGYIKGYVPGVRENGGQYTHAAIWAAMAFARLGDQARTWELFSMINPVNHGSSSGQIATYKVEPYVVAADVYAVAPHRGRGGWTWYTGSAGWMYRLILESILGLRLDGDTLRFVPCLPAHWEGFTVHYRYRETTYHIAVTHGADGVGKSQVTVDGVARDDAMLPLSDDRREHMVEVRAAAGHGQDDGRAPTATAPDIADDGQN